MSSFMARLLTTLLLLVMVVFSFTPIPGTTLIVLYVVLFRPRWFKRLVDLIYEEIHTTKNKPEDPETPSRSTGESVSDKVNLGQK